MPQRFLHKVMPRSLPEQLPATESSPPYPKGVDETFSLQICAYSKDYRAPLICTARSPAEATQTNLKDKIETFYNISQGISRREQGKQNNNHWRSRLKQTI